MMLADSKVSNLTPLSLEEKRFFPVIPFPASHFIPIEQSRPIFNLPSTDEEKNINDDSLQRSNCELSDIFRLYGEEYRKKHNLTFHQLKTMKDIEKCRTFELGYHIDRCDNCGYTEVMANSCGNRHCPKCQASRRMNWVEARVKQLLPVPYYHVVFTVPDKIFPLCLYNQEVVYDLLFKSSSETLKAFGRDPKWLGGELGFYGILHTWSQTLISHVHVHVVVAGGGVDDRGNWVFPRHKDKFLFPVKAMSKVFRGKFIEGLEEAYKGGELSFPGDLEGISGEEGFKCWLRKLVSTDWVVYSKRPFSGPEEVVRYISRYTHRTAISNSRILSVSDGKVRFRYKDYKKMKEDTSENVWEEMELKSEEFIRRFLYHVLPSGYHRIRYYGFLSNGNSAKREEALESLLFNEEVCREDERETEATYYEGIFCPECKTGKMEVIIIVNGRGQVIRGEELIKNMDFRLNTS
jgi:predicted Zn-ribbon and HTH transcriptional regulator